MEGSSPSSYTFISSDIEAKTEAAFRERAGNLTRLEQGDLEPLLNKFCELDGCSHPHQI